MVLVIRRHHVRSRLGRRRRCNRGHGRGRWACLLSDVPHTLRLRVHGHRLRVHGHRWLGERRPTGLPPRRVLRGGHLLHNGRTSRRTNLTWRRRNASRCRRKDRFVHAAGGATHRVLPRGIAIVGGSGLRASHAVVHIVDVAAMSVAVVPILESLHRRGGIGVRWWLRRRAGCRS